MASHSNPFVFELQHPCPNFPSQPSVGPDQKWDDRREIGGRSAGDRRGSSERRPYVDICWILGNRRSAYKTPLGVSNVPQILSYSTFHSGSDKERVN